MAKWRKVGIILKPLFKFECLGCRDSLATFSETGYRLQNFPITMENQDDYNSYAIDRTYHCNFCGWELVFGIALTKGHFKELLDAGRTEFTRHIS